MFYSDRKPQLLIVDDEVEICSLLREYLQDRCAIEVAHNGRDAFQKINRSAPDCILLDNRNVSRIP
ncbi:hypothetical protein UR09_01315 [Candidatus Nitromaritima sp. SCGC AAA799-A02]|nr:hypothetical protein UR09_01315 [Candidatus Nitromaritima sp. SCGC AAA799-A02]